MSGYVTLLYTFSQHTGTLNRWKGRYWNACEPNLP